MSFALPRVRYALSESRSLRVEREVDGKFHPKVNVLSRPTANEYYEGKMHRTSKRLFKSA